MVELEKLSDIEPVLSTRKIANPPPKRNSEVKCLRKLLNVDSEYKGLYLVPSGFSEVQSSVTLVSGLYSLLG